MTGATEQVTSPLPVRSGI